MAEQILDFKNFAQVTDARWYPRYHIAAPCGWCNDPNGFCFYNGQYHMFYQFYPYDAQWGPMHWGHVVSDDLAYWKHLPIALKPDQPYDEGGCFSGSAIEKDGRLYLMYTGFVPDKPQTQALAVSEDGIHFEKSTLNPILTVPQSEEIHGGDFRDPKVWLHDGKYYSIIGGRSRDEQEGFALLFKSNDLVHWNFVNISARTEGNEGKMWECPNFAEIDGQDVLVFSPMLLDTTDGKFFRDKAAGVLIGKLDYVTGIFDRGEFQYLDKGFNFYAPQITQTPDGRTIMIGWLATWDVEMHEAVDGWAGQMTIPRELHVRDGKIFSTPVKELEKLRKWKPVTYEDVVLDESATIDGVAGDAYELLLTIDAAESKTFSIALRASEIEQTILRYDHASGKFTFDRTNSGQLIRELDFTDGIGVKPADFVREINIGSVDKLKLHIFIDRSSVEVFINDGAEVLSARIYPKRTSQEIIFKPEAELLEIDSLEFYKLDFGFPHPHIKEQAPEDLKSKFPFLK